MSPTMTETFESRNPATGDLLASFRAADPAGIDHALDLAARGQSEWRACTLDQRCRSFASLAAELRAHRDEDALLATREMGKPLAEARQEIDKCAWLCEWYAENGPAILAERRIGTDARTTLVRAEPLGTVLGIMPWNYPFWQAYRAAIPIMLSGNGFLLKHAPNVLGCGERIAARAGAVLPSGALTHLIASIDAVPGLLADRRIMGLTLTGSPRAGRAAARAAADALKPSLLELGGSDAFVVLDDADVERAAASALASRFQNCGQSCIAAKRFLVARPVLDEFVELMAAGAQSLVVGDPENESTTLGPLCRLSAREPLEAAEAASRVMGATAVLPLSRPDLPGAYLTPGILRDCRPGMPAVDEETFGPLAAVLAFDTDDEAVDLANASRYGLGGSVWSRDGDRGMSFARRLETGAVFVNGMTHSDPRMPFGGIKESGYGRELSIEGAHAFVNTKTIWVG